MKNAARLTFAMMLFPALLLQAQYAINWHTLDGGGGSSAVGPYRISATAGQPDTGTASGGGYAIESGYWIPVVILQTPGAPALRMAPQAAGMLRLMWSKEGSGGYQLQYADSLHAVHWINEPVAPQDGEGDWHITISPHANKRFFRLMKP